MAKYIVCSQDCYISGGESEGVELVTTSRKKAYKYIKNSVNDVLNSGNGYYIDEPLEEPDSDTEISYINDNCIDSIKLKLSDGYSHITYKLFKLI